MDFVRSQCAIFDIHVMISHAVSDSHWLSERWGTIDAAQFWPSVVFQHLRRSARLWWPVPRPLFMHPLTWQTGMSSTNAS